MDEQQPQNQQTQIPDNITKEIVQTKTKSTKPLVIAIGLMIIILFLLGFGAYIFLGGKTNRITNENSVNQPTPVNGNIPSIPGESNTEITQNKVNTSITPSASLQTYSSPCISFKYPSEFQKFSDKITTEHKIFQGKDVYGTTGVTFTEAGQAGTKDLIQISCMPNFGNIDNNMYLKQYQDDFNSQAKTNIAGDHYQFITIGGKSALRVLHNDYNSGTVSAPGLDDVYTSDNSYTYRIELGWPTALDNDMSLPSHQLFESLLQTVTFPQ